MSILVRTFKPLLPFGPEDLSYHKPAGVTHLVLSEDCEVACACGWKKTLRLYHLTTAKIIEIAADVMAEHYDEERAKLNPTIADMTDWGWFCPEAA